MSPLGRVVTIKIINLNNDEVLLTPADCGPENYYEVSPSLFRSLLTIPELPSPMSMSVDEINNLRANQFKRSRLLSLPRELIDEITSHLWISSSSPVLHSNMRSQSIVTEATDLIALALTCRYFLIILHPTIRRVLENGAAAPWAGKMLFIGYRMGGDPLDFRPKKATTSPECYSVVMQVLRRLKKDEEQHRIDGLSQLTKDNRSSHELLGKVFERDIMGMAPRNAVGADGGGSNRVPVLRDLDGKHYARIDAPPCAGLAFSPMNLKLLGTFWRRKKFLRDFLRKFPPTIRVDIRTLSNEELGGWTDTTGAYLEPYTHQL